MSTQALRRLETLFVDAPRLGRSLRPAEDPVRLTQEPSLAFAAATLAGFQLPKNGIPPRLSIAFGGLLGPQGPLPLHFTEYARDRIINSRDTTLTRFLDIFHHRMLSLVYRAWADAQPTVQFDRPNSDRFRAALATLPSEQRDVYLLHEESDLSLEEIARITGVGAETAKSRLRYAVAKLKAALSATEA